VPLAFITVAQVRNARKRSYFAVDWAIAALERAAEGREAEIAVQIRCGYGITANTG
jgi:hypothetical protein